MSGTPDVTRLRRYLLGDTTDDENAAIELEYLSGDGASGRIDTIDAAEEALVEDYLDSQLTSDERRRFDRYYLSTAEHRAFVATIRNLRVAASHRGTPRSATSTVAAPARRSGAGLMLALAATLILAVGSLVWISERGRVSPAPTPSPVETPAPIAPRTFTHTLSPAGIRSANDRPPLVIPSGTDVVSLQLQGEGADRPSAAGRVVIRGVSGGEVWQGSIGALTAPVPPVIARVDVPVAVFRASEDYVVILNDIGADGAVSERYRYFLRVRDR